MKAIGELYSVSKNPEKIDDFFVKNLHSIVVEVNVENADRRLNPVFMLDYFFDNNKLFRISFHSNCIQILEIENDKIIKAYQLHNTGEMFSEIIDSQ